MRNISVNMFIIVNGCINYYAWIALFSRLMYLLCATKLLGIDIDLFDSLDCLIVKFEMLTFSSLTGYCKILSWVDFFEGCSVRRFGWSIRDIQFLASCLVGCFFCIALLVLTSYFYTCVGSESLPLKCLHLFISLEAWKDLKR